MSRPSRIMAALALAILLVPISPPSYAANQSSPTVSLQESWSLPAEPPQGSVISARPPGLYASPDSTRVYSLLNRRSFGGYGCDGGVESALQAIDTASGAVVSSLPLGISPTTPIQLFAMDDNAGRLVVNTRCLDNFLWTSIDATTGAKVAQWTRGTWADRVAMGVDPNLIFVLTGTGNVANGDYQKVIEAVSTTTGATLWVSPVKGAPTSQGGWVGSTITTGRQYEGQPMAVSGDGRRLYVLRWWSQEVEVLDTATGASVGVIALPESRDLRNIVASPVTHRAFITDWTNNRIHVIDTDSLSLVSTLQIPGRCLESIDIDATGELLAVMAACDNPRTILVRTSDGSIVSEAPVPGDVTAVSLTPNGRGMVIARSASLAGFRVVETLPAAKGSKGARPVPAPQAPRNATAVASGTSATVTWSRPANAVAAKVTGYRVTIRPGEGTCVVRVKKLRCLFTGLTPGRRYVFQVSARNSAQYGLRSDTAITTIPLPPPVAPVPTTPSPPEKLPQPIS